MPNVLRACDERHRLELVPADVTLRVVPKRMPTNVLSMRLVTDLHETLHRWTVWATDAIAVLDADDEAAIDQQTQEVLRSIAQSPSLEPK